MSQLYTSSGSQVTGYPPRYQKEEGKMLCGILKQAMKSGHDECRITAHKGEEKAAEQPLTASVAMVCPPPGLGGSADG